eukprot:5469482-Amphidinium_carterae.1
MRGGGNLGRRLDAPKMVPRCNCADKEALRPLPCSAGYRHSGHTSLRRPQRMWSLQMPAMSQPPTGPA